MSAWVVSKTHIDVLVTAAVHWGVYYRVDHANENALGQMLWDENVKSVSARYREDSGAGTEGYTWNVVSKTPVEVLKAIACYEYQSCEHEGWKGSRAFSFCDQLRYASIIRLPGYKQAPWGFTEEHAPECPVVSLIERLLPQLGGW